MQRTGSDLSDNFHRLFAGLVYTLHTGLLTYFLVMTYVSDLWYFWIIFDSFVIIFLVYSFIVTYIRKRSNVVSGGLINRLLDHDYPGQLPFAAWVWLLISLSSGIRIGILFRSSVITLIESKAYSPTLLHITLGLLCPLFYLTVKSLRLKTKFANCDYEELVFIIFECTNFLDSTDILINLYSSTNGISDSVRLAVIIFAILTNFVPSLPLIKYTKVTYGAVIIRGKLDLIVGLDIIYCVAGILVNVALFIMRIVIWRSYLITISGEYLVKEIFFCYLYIVKVCKYFIEKSSQYKQTEA